MLIRRRELILGAAAALAMPAIVRASPGLWLPLRGLEFPQGRAAGFDPSHLAALNTRISAVALPTGGAMQSLAASAAPTASTGVNAPTSVITGFGPGMNSASGTFSYNTFPNPVVETPSAVTFAVIVTPLVGINSGGIIGNSGTSNTSPTSLLQWSGTSFQPAIRASAQIASSLALQLGHASLVVASLLSGTKVNFLVVDLTTGQVTTHSTTTAVTIGTPATQSVAVGALGAAGLATGGYIHAAMYAVNNYLSMPQLIAWAQDPWGFWYP